MTHYVVEAEVAGGLGNRTELDTTSNPPIVHRLHYEFDGWLGDPLVESFPCFLIEKEAAGDLEANGLTGVSLDAADVSRSDQFAELYPGRLLPKFLWLKPTGIVAKDDVSQLPDGRLVLSERALDILKKHGLAHALIDIFEDVK